MTTEKKYFPFIKMKWIFGGISLFFILASLYQIVIKGMNFGVDFSGGTKIVYQFANPTSDGELRSVLDEAGVKDAEIVRFGNESENTFLIKSKVQDDQSQAGKIKEALTKKFGEGKFTLLSEELVGPKVGKEMRQKGLFSIILTWALILVYIGLRFDFLFAPGAVVALLHDVIISLGFFTFFGREFNLPILAAVLTIIGYSINDTIVIYDRIRENLRKFPSSMSLSELVNISLNETLSRTIVTSLTVFFALVILYFFGGGVLNDFAFCMIVGIVAGSYSTLFIASPIYLMLHRLFPKKGMEGSQHRAS